MSTDKPTPGRKHLVESAAYWFRNAFVEGQTKAGAVHSMENAYNHVENALAATIAERDEYARQLAEVTRERDEFQQELQKVCDHEWIHQDNSFDHEFGTEQVHSCLCEKCGATKPYEPETFEDEAKS